MKKQWQEQWQEQQRSSPLVFRRVQESDNINANISIKPKPDLPMPATPRSVGHPVQDFTAITVPEPEPSRWPGAREGDAALLLGPLEAQHAQWRAQTKEQLAQHRALFPLVPRASDVPFDPGAAEGRRDSLESCGSSDKSSQPDKSSPQGGRAKREGKDEKIAREKGLDVFISVADIINIPMDEFNEKLEAFKKDGTVVEAGGQLLMTEDQSTLAREIRRRGKNKNAAQDCRKRANKRIDNLKRDVLDCKKKKLRLQQEKPVLNEMRREWQRKNDELAQSVLKQLPATRNYPHHWMLEDDPVRGIVKPKKIPLEVIQGPPPMIRVPRPQLPPLCQRAATLHRVLPGQRAPAFAATHHSVSLYPAHAAIAAGLQPDVSLFPVSFFPPPPPLELRAGFSSPTEHAFRHVLPRHMEMEVEVKEEEPEDLRVVSEREVAIIDPVE